MSGRVIESPEIEHRCFFLYPVEAGLFASRGTRWRCDGCGTVWKLGEGGWAVEEPISRDS